MIPQTHGGRARSPHARCLDRQPRCTTVLHSGLRHAALGCEGRRHLCATVHVVGARTKARLPTQPPAS